MSADNYLYVRKLPDGKYAVDDRSASCYYRDEGDTADDLAHAGGDDSWLVDPPVPRHVFDSAAEAIVYAHRYEREEIVEYGIAFGPGVDDDLLAPSAKEKEA